MKRPALVVGAIAIFATTAAAASVPSEIRRGDAEAGACAAEHPHNVKSLVQCIWDIADKAETPHRDVRAFQLGLIYAASVYASEAIEANAPLAHTSADAAGELMLAKLGFRRSCERMHRIQMQLGVSDAQLVALVPIRSRGTWLARLRQWERQR